jgi:hypothetical protein
MYELNENLSHMTDTERILEIIRVKNLNNIQFCSATGISPASLSHITSNRSKPTLSILRNVIAGFPEINPEWVMMGTGPMFRDPDKMVQIENARDSADTNRPVRTDNERMNSLFPNEDNEVAGKADLVARRGREKNLPSDMVEEVVKTTLTMFSKQRQQRKIVEVKVFYDDGTFESFGKN